MKINLNGDVNRYRVKAVGGFTLRQICFGVVGIAVMILLILALSKVLPMMIATLIGAFVGVAVIMCGILQYSGMSLFKMVCTLLKGGKNYKYEVEGVEAFEFQKEKERAELEK